MTYMRCDSFLAVLGASLILAAGCGDDAASGDPDSAPQADGAPVDSAPQADASIPLGEPIQAPEQMWTWVPFDDARCANDTPTGIGVNLSSASSNVLIYLQGGGACCDQLTCYLLSTAVNLDGYGEADFQADATGILTTSLFDRADPQNPARDWSFVFVPYCTGDVHSGSNEADHGGQRTLHVGYDNMTAYLARIVPTFPAAERVVLSGSSAGGYGAGFNWTRVQDLFGETRVDLLDDSGPPIPPPYAQESLEQAQRTAWGWSNTLPADCPECLDDLHLLLNYSFTKYPDSRKALLSYTRDTVIANFSQIPSTDVEQALNVLATESFDPFPTAQYFYVTGSSHVLLGDPASVSQNNVVLMDWLTQMITDDPTWASVAP